MKIRLELCRQNPVEYILSSSCGTHAMNFASWIEAVCLFPCYTLKRQTFLNVVDCPDDLKSIDRCVSVGYSVVLDQELRSDNRFVSDGISKVLSFAPIEGSADCSIVPYRSLKFRIRRGVIFLEGDFMDEI